jgi:hypothetical protein
MLEPMHLKTNTTLQGGKYRITRTLGQGGFGKCQCVQIDVMGTESSGLVAK